MKTPTIPNVTNLQNGEIIKSIDFFSMDEESIFKIRTENERYLQKDIKFLVCSLCHQSVKIRGGIDKAKSLHFSHLHSSGDCPIKTGQSYTTEEINAMKYNGAKESEEHKKIKKFIYEMLSKDNNFSNTGIEKTFKNTGLQRNWKRPDVSTVYKNQNIVFEIQLSTTFLDVIVSRQNFYYSNNTNIVWVFNKFPEDLSKLRFTEKDILYSNKNNIFVLDDEMMEKSLHNNVLIFKCYYMKPFRNKKGQIESTWKKEEIEVNNITFDEVTNKSYIFNYDSAKARLLFEDKLKKINPIYGIIIDGIKEVEAHGGLKYDWNLSNVLDSTIFDYFDPFSLEELVEAEELIGFLLTILFYGRKQQRDYESRYRSSDGYFIRILNHMIDYKKEYIDIILRAIDIYDKRLMIIDNDKKGKFRERLINYKKDTPLQSNKHDKVIQFLFPELFYNMGVPIAKK